MAGKTFDPTPDYPGGAKITAMRKDDRPRALVKAIQLRLVKAGCFKAEDVDARWDLKTKRAIKCLQRKKGLTADGVPGPVTWEKGFGWKVPFQGSGNKDYPYIWRRPGVSLPNDALCKALNALGKELYEKYGKRLVMVSGQRTMAQQWHLYNGWVRRLPGFNLAAYPNPNAPHIKNGGSAADVGVEGKSGGGYMSLLNFAPANGLIGKYGLFKQVPSEPWHMALRSQW